MALLTLKTQVENGFVAHRLSLPTSNNASLLSRLQSSIVNYVYCNLFVDAVTDSLLRALPCRLCRFQNVILLNCCGRCLYFMVVNNAVTGKIHFV